MNKVIEWALNALLNDEYAIPDDDFFKQSLMMAGLKQDELATGQLEIKHGMIESIFSQIRLDEKSSTTEKRWLEWQPLDPRNEKVPKPSKEKSNNIDKLKQEIEKVKNTQFVNESKKDEAKALLFIEKYGTYLSASASQPYLSYFDCVKNAAAIYRCIEVNQHKSNFIMVGGDLSGIQNYLFNMSESQSKGVAKILRARSFRLGLFTEICRHFILQSMELPLYCTLVDAGGRFILIVPDDQKFIDILEKIEVEIQRFCLHNYNGELILNLSYDTKLTEDDFESNKLIEKFNDLNCSIENRKYKAFKEEIADNGWSTEKFVISENYDDYDFGVCEVSGYLPKKSAKRYSSEFELDRDIGKHLVKSNLLGFRKSEKKTTKKEKECVIEFPFSSINYCVHFLEEDQLNGSHDFYMVQHLKGKLTDKFTPRFFANYVPKFEYLKYDGDYYYPFEDRKEYRIKLKEKEKEKDKKDQFKPTKGDIIDFGTLAHAGVAEIKDENSVSKAKHFAGTDLLGVIKADVDRMGQLFISGINHIFSLSSYSTLSRQLDLFF
ncbi:MAG: hypothetical protein SCK70_10430, partial [bacterium]|nr:hypothetical protein [bacterium]